MILTQGKAHITPHMRLTALSLLHLSKHPSWECSIRVPQEILDHTQLENIANPQVNIL